MPDNYPMTPREIFRRIMRFEKPDRTPLWQVEGIADRGDPLLAGRGQPEAGHVALRRHPLRRSANARHAVGRHTLLCRAGAGTCAVKMPLAALGRTQWEGGHS
jgi:hypothetical protein